MRNCIKNLSIIFKTARTLHRHVHDADAMRSRKKHRGGPSPQTPKTAATFYY